MVHAPVSSRDIICNDVLSLSTTLALLFHPQQTPGPFNTGDTPPQCLTSAFVTNAFACPPRKYKLHLAKETGVLVALFSESWTEQILNNYGWMKPQDQVPTDPTLFHTYFTSIFQNSGQEKWLNSLEHSLFLQKTLVWFPLPIGQLTTTYNSGSRWFNALFWPPLALQPLCTLTYMKTKHLFT